MLFVSLYSQHETNLYNLEAKDAGLEGVEVVSVFVALSLALWVVSLFVTFSEFVPVTLSSLLDFESTLSPLSRLVT